jgi:hypothetical protein
VPPGLLLTGLTCGMLLTAAGLALWGHFRQVPGLDQAVQVIRWVAGPALLVSALLARLSDRSLSPLTSRLILMAALATMPPIRRRPGSPRPSVHTSVMLILSPLILTGTALLLSQESTDIPVSPPVPLVEIAVTVCGGLGVRTLSEALDRLVTRASRAETVEGSASLTTQRAFATTYALLTLVMGGMATVSLWQRGTMQEGIDGGDGLVGTWLAWSAAWVCPRQPPWLRETLTVAAALSLVSMVLRAT